MKNEKPKIKSEHFFKFFMCPHWIWYDLYEDKENHQHIPPLMEMLYRGELQDKKGSLKKWQYEEIQKELFQDLEEAHFATLELMKQGKNIYRGVLMHENWVGEPDFLEARPSSELPNGLKSNFGDWYYAAYDIKNDPEIKNEYKFPLVFSSLILERIQGVMPPESFLVNAEGEVKSFLNEPYIEEFQLTCQTIEKILEGEKPAPFLKSGCKKTPWYSVCSSETKGCNDISLIYHISQGEQRRLYDVGIKTVEQLASTDINKLQEKLEDWEFDKLIRLQNQAQALIKQEPLIIRKYPFAEVANEIYFDVESDPTQSIDYFLGILTRNKNGEKYKFFLAKSREEEKTIWQDFLKFLEGLEDFVIYHYGYYERYVFNRLYKKYGAPIELVRKFEDHTVDLHKVIISSVVLPLYFYSLKDVAKYLGFSWNSEDASGAESVLWYNEWLKSGDDKIMKKLTEYNEDDVRATLFVKKWLEQAKPTTQKMKLEEE